MSPPTTEEMRSIAQAVISNPLCLCNHPNCKYKQMQMVARAYLELTEPVSNDQSAPQGGSQSAVSRMQQDQEDTRSDAV